MNLIRTLLLVKNRSRNFILKYLKLGWVVWLYELHFDLDQLELHIFHCPTLYGVLVHRVCIVNPCRILPMIVVG
jgi:hypothetical protein